MNEQFLLTKEEFSALDRFTVDFRKYTTIVLDQKLPFVIKHGESYIKFDPDGDIIISAGKDLHLGNTSIIGLDDGALKDFENFADNNIKRGPIKSFSKVGTINIEELDPEDTIEKPEITD